MNQEAPKCPTCGISMKLRTARTGPNAGGYFWGCNNYKKPGKHALPYIPIDGGDINIEIPVALEAKSYILNGQTNFYQTVALPKEEMLNISFDDDFRYFNQWRIDFIKPKVKSSDNKQLFLIAHKILTRGKWTICSPMVSERLKIYKNQKIYLSSSPNKIDLFDSDSERDFYYKELPEILGNNYQKFVTPQIYFSSLVSEDEIDESQAKQRVDFLITRADGEAAIVELDGAHHKETMESDNNRDKILKKNGYNIFRYDLTKDGTELKESIKKFFNDSKVNNNHEITATTSLYRIIHQAEVAIVESYINNLATTSRPMYFQIKLPLEIEAHLENVIISLIQDDLTALLSNIYELYGITKKPNFTLGKQKKSGAVLISWVGFKDFPEAMSLYISDIISPIFIANYDKTKKIENAIDAKEVKSENLNYFLNYFFGYDSFNEGQEIALKRALQQKDSIILLPTGSGKSLIFQMAGLIMPGISVVISPIISLIEDQIDELKRIGIDRAAPITGSIKKEDKIIMERLLGKGEYIFCYIAPERLQNDDFRDQLKNISSFLPVPIVVIDEAHCISEWGHSFRTSYLRIAQVSRDICKYLNTKKEPAIMALTGTASYAVLKDVQRELEIDESKDTGSVITPESFGRKELRFMVIKVPSEKKIDELRMAIESLVPESLNFTKKDFYKINGKSTNCGYIFCPNVKGPYGVVDLGPKISKLIDMPVKMYAGTKMNELNIKHRPPEGAATWNEYKKKVMKDFKNNEFNLLVANKAAGMGLNKPNVRFTIHYGIPGSIESFYQEAGRAGRAGKKDFDEDGNIINKEAICLIIYSNDYKDKNNILLSPEITNSEKLRSAFKEIGYHNQDDISRNLYLLNANFCGEEAEIILFKSIFSQILKAHPNINKKGSVKKVFIIPLEVLNGLSDYEKSNTDNLIEKVIHRLTIIGVIEDYTIKRANKEFDIRISGITKTKMVNKYLNYIDSFTGLSKKEKESINIFAPEEYIDLINFLYERLIDFVYQNIESSRRSSLNELVLLCEKAIQEKDIKKQSKFINDQIEAYFNPANKEVKDISESKDSAGLDLISRALISERNKSGSRINCYKNKADALKVRGQAIRFLESKPNHPGLRLLRGAAEAFVEKPDIEILSANIFAAHKFAKENLIDNSSIFIAIIDVLKSVALYRPETYSLVARTVINKIDDRIFARMLMDSVGDIIEPIEPLAYLFTKINNKVIESIKEFKR